MPLPKVDLPQTAKPILGDHFDAWNSSSTGHQRAENRLGGSIGWRQSRSMKLSHQFRSGQSGGERISDTIGAGSEDWDEKAKALIPRHVRERAKYNVLDMLVAAPKKSVAGSSVMHGSDLSSKAPVENRAITRQKQEDEILEESKSNCQRKIFAGLVIYINGSTYPHISDHKLKHLLAENGARLSIHLGRRTVTHVILGRPSKAGDASAAGGGLSGTKLDKEIQKVKGCGIKFVGVEWVLESIKAGRRLSEAQFAVLKMAIKSQNSVYGMFKHLDSESTV